MNELLTITEAAERIRTGRLRPRELVEQCLDQIREHDPRLRAWVEVDEAGARRDAERLGREAAAGNCLGPLHGIPIGIKDIIDVAGMPTKAGSPLRADHRAAADAPLVASLRRAGGHHPRQDGYGRVRLFRSVADGKTPGIPRCATRPGGSSSGSAVAVLMGMCFRGPGYADRRLVGAAFVPTAASRRANRPLGLLSRKGIVPVSRHFDHPPAPWLDRLPIWRSCCVSWADDGGGSQRLSRSPGRSRQESECPDRPPISLPPKLGWLQGLLHR